LILAVALFRGDNMLTTLQFALVLTVAAVPVAMPAVLSVTMAVGARKWRKNKRSLPTWLQWRSWRDRCALFRKDRHTNAEQTALGEPFCVGGVTVPEIILAASLASRAENQDSS
jgi:H+-transporting ATPase